VYARVTQAAEAEDFTLMNIEADILKLTGDR
jgi:hypothetical protein